MSHGEKQVPTAAYVTYGADRGRSGSVWYDLGMLTMRRYPGFPIPVPQTFRTGVSVGAPSGLASQPVLMPGQHQAQAGNMVRIRPKQGPSVDRILVRVGGQTIYDSQTPSTVDVNLATLDAPETVEPTCHIWTESRIAWFDTADALPRYPDNGPEPHA